MPRVRDALDRELEVPAAPQRIVSLVPSLTELLADLELDAQVVGLTTFCVRPAGWREQKTRVGGTKRVDLERVRALDPDLILANQEENTAADVEALSALAPVYVTRVADLPQALDMIREVGQLTARAPQAAALIEHIAAAFAGLPSPTRRPRVAYLIWREPLMVAGGGTFIDAMLDAAGCENAFADRERYPQTSAEELTRLDLDALLLSSEPFPFRATHAGALEAEVGCQTLLVDGEPFSWYGSRLLSAPASFAELRDRLG